MSNEMKKLFKRGAAKKKQFNKAVLNKVADAGKSHDGQNFSCLAVSREHGLTKDNFVNSLQRFVSENITTELGWEKAAYKEHMVLTNDRLKRTYYYKPIGVPDATMEGGMRIFDFHINAHFKDDYELWLKKQK